MFSAPQDPARLLEWEKRIRRADKKLTPAAVVCERHFEGSCIERTFKIVIGGVVNEIPRALPRLKPDAVPTIFEDYARCGTPKHGRRRKKLKSIREEGATYEAIKQRNGRREAVESCLAIDEDSGSEDDVPCPGETTVSAESDDEERPCSRGSTTSDDHSEDGSAQHESPKLPVGHVFEDLQISGKWARVPCLSEEGSLAYARCEMQDGDFSCLFIERMVVFGAASSHDGSVTATVYLRGRESFKENLATRCAAEEFINDIDAVTLCEGCGVKPMTTKYTSYRDMYFAEKCLIIAGPQGESCARCKHARKLAEKQMCKAKRKVTSQRPGA